MTSSSKSFDVDVFLWSSLVTGPSFMSFTVSELLRENQLGADKITPPPSPTQIKSSGLNSL